MDKDCEETMLARRHTTRTPDEQSSSDAATGENAKGKASCMCGVDGYAL